MEDQSPRNPKKEDNIQRLPDGRYRVHVCRRVHGRQVHRKGTVANIGEARRLARQFVDELTGLQYHAPIYSWDQALVDFIEQAKVTMTAHTAESAALTLMKHTAPWRGKAATEIKTSEIEQLIRGANVEAQGTRVKLYQYVSGVFSMLEGKGIIPVSPFRHIKRRALLGKKVERMKEIMSAQEVVRLLDHLNAHNDPWFSIVAVTYHLGLRAGEAIALSWEQVDLARNLVTIDRSYDKKKQIIGPTKSGKVRTIPINKTLSEILKQLRAKAPEGQEFVLPRIPDFVLGHAARTLKVTQKRLGIKPTTFHALRAAFITHLLLKGVPVAKVQNIVGHADLKTTLVYLRVVGADVIGATEVLDLVDQGKENSRE